MQPESSPARGVQAAFVEDRSFLRALLYRMTGVGADADDLLQETFARALSRPPPDLSQPLRPWLVRVAMNLARDHLRRRRRRPYVGPWLPGLDPEAADTALSPAARYDQQESASLAFLLALEALSPAQRGALILRDVCDYSAEETGQALGLSSANVRTLHLRARRALEAYDRQRPPPSPEREAVVQQALFAFLEALASGDLARIEACLSASVVEHSDAGRDFLAARRPIRGPRRVARFHFHAKRKGLVPLALSLVPYAGQLGWAVRLPGRTDQRGAETVWMSADVDASGKISAIYTILAPRKLARLALSESLKVT